MGRGMPLNRTSRVPSCVLTAWQECSACQTGATGAKQASALLQDAREKLKSSQHELAAIQKQRDDLARRLALIREKISSGMIPDPADLAVPEHIAAAAEASASSSAVHPMP